MDRNEAVKNVMEEEQKRNWKIVRNRTCIRAGLIFLGVLGMQMLAAIVLGILISIRAFLESDNYMGMIQNITGAYDDLGQYTILLSVICAVASGVWCGILYYRSEWRVRPFNYKQAFAGKTIPLIVVTVAGACVVLSVLLTVLQQLVPVFFKNYNQLMETISEGDAALSIIYVIVIGPISEELIFRGALFDRFYLVFSFWIANILQATLFGIYHMNVIQGIYAFLLGILLGMIRQMTGSILAAIFSHMVFNATSYVFTFLISASGKYAAAVFCILFFLSIFVVAVGGKSIWEMCTRKVEKRQEN